MIGHVVLDGFRVDAVWQHPALVVVSTQPQLALLVRVHGPLVHPEAPVGGHVLVPLQSSLVSLPAQLVLLLVDALGGYLGLPAGLVFYEVALVVKGDGPDAFLLELEQAGFPVAPLVPRQPLLFLLLELLPKLRLDGLLQLVVRQGEVHPVRVHLDELEVALVEEVVQEVVVEPQHAELGQLVHHDSHLEGTVDCDLWLAALDLVDVPDCFQVFEPSRAELLVHLVLVLCVQRPHLALHCFDELAVGAVAQELEYFREQRFFLVRVTRPSCIGDRIHEPVEDLLGHVIDRAVDSRDLEAAVEIPLQEGGVDEHLFRRQNAQELLLVWETGSTAISEVVLHVLRDSLVRHSSIDEEGRKLLELFPQLPGDFDVHLREAEPLSCHQLNREPVRRLHWIVVVHDPPWAAGHVIKHRAWVEGVGVEAQDTLRDARCCVFVGADAGLAGHMLAREHQTGAADYSPLQHGVCFGPRSV